MPCFHWGKDKIPECLGGEPKCAFTTLKGNFTSKNWNCKLMNDLRTLLEDDRIYSEDESAVLRAIPYNDNEDEYIGDYVLLTWYKNRGKTDGFWIVMSNIIRKGTEEECKEIIRLIKLNNLEKKIKKKATKRFLK